MVALFAIPVATGCLESLAPEFAPDHLHATWLVNKFNSANPSSCTFTSRHLVTIRLHRSKRQGGKACGSGPETTHIAAKVQTGIGIAETALTLLASGCPCTRVSSPIA